jgi:hypothetical protein
MHLSAWIIKTFFISFFLLSGDFYYEIVLSSLSFYHKIITASSLTEELEELTGDL